MAADDLENRIERIEQQIDSLATSVDARFGEHGARFDRLETVTDDAFAEQRRCSEFAFETLGSEMRDGFSRIERKLDGFIDAQTRTNALAERRLQRLEARDASR